MLFLLGLLSWYNKVTLKEALLMAFRENSNQQLSFNDTLWGLTEREKKALEKSWARTFAEEIFPNIDETRFSVLYSDKASRPNTPINVIVGDLVIKELFDYSDDEIVENLRETIDIPIIVTVVSKDEDIKARIESGATILNVSGGKNTAAIVRKIKSEYPAFPVLATGGPTEETIRATIEAGANAITYTPPYNGEIMSALMDRYRDK